MFSPQRNDECMRWWVNTNYLIWSLQNVCIYYNSTLYPISMCSYYVLIKHNNDVLPLWPFLGPLVQAAQLSRHVHPLPVPGRWGENTGRSMSFGLAQLRVLTTSSHLWHWARSVLICATGVVLPWGIGKTPCGKMSGKWPSWLYLVCRRCHTLFIDPVSFWRVWNVTRNSREVSGGHATCHSGIKVTHVGDTWRDAKSGLHSSAVEVCRVLGFFFFSSVFILFIAYDTFGN